MRRAFHLFGGWPGHVPYKIGDWTRGLLQELDFLIDESNDIFALDRDLSAYDLIVIGWNNAVTTETLTASQERHLLGAVEQGSGLAGWHGAGAAFRSSLPYHWLLGGSFLDHPAGEGVPHPYKVTIGDRDHPITRGVSDFDVASEQYYMQVDPNVHVLAETVFNGEPYPWLAGNKSPVAWARNWGAGRVFYHSIGHDLSNLAGADIRRLTLQGLQWAARDPA